MPLVARSALRPAAAVILTAAIGIGLASVGAAEETKSLDALLRQLQSTDWATRQAAEDAIVALGAGAIEPIQAVLLATDDAEVRERLRSAVQRIGRDELLRPTLVTVAGTFATPADAFDVLARSAGLPLAYESDAARALATADKPLDLDIRNEPWLTALTRTMNRAGISIRVEETRLLVQERPRTRTNDPIMQTLGAVSIRVETARLRRSLDLATDATSSNFTLGFSVALEPKLRVRNAVMMQISKLADSTDRELGDPRNRRYTLNRTNPNLFNGGVQLMPQAGATHIGVFEGELLLDLVTRSNLVRITELASLPTTVSSIGGEITLDTLTKAGDAWELQFRLPTGGNTFGQREQAPNTLRALAGENLKVLDQNGKPMRLAAPELMGIDNGLVARVSVQPIEPESKPATIEWNLPTQTRQVRLPFKFSDLVLP